MAIYIDGIETTSIKVHKGQRITGQLKTSSNYNDTPTITGNYVTNVTITPQSSNFIYFEFVVSNTISEDSTAQFRYFITQGKLIVPVTETLTLEYEDQSVLTWSDGSTSKYKTIPAGSDYYSEVLEFEYSNVEDLVVSCDKNYVNTVLNKSGKKIYVTISKNNTTSSRTIIVKLTGVDNVGITKTILSGYFQEPNSSYTQPVFDIEPKNLNYDSTMSTQNVTTTQTEVFNIKFTIPSWMRISISGNILNVRCLENSNPYPRSIIVPITAICNDGTTITRQLTVNQSGKKSAGDITTSATTLNLEGTLGSEEELYYYGYNIDGQIGLSYNTSYNNDLYIEFTESKVLVRAKSDNKTGHYKVWSDFRLYGTDFNGDTVETFFTVYQLPYDTPNDIPIWKNDKFDISFELGTEKEFIVSDTKRNINIYVGKLYTGLSSSNYNIFIRDIVKDYIDNYIITDLFNTWQTNTIIYNKYGNPVNGYSHIKVSVYSNSEQSNYKDVYYGVFWDDWSYTEINQNRNILSEPILPYLDSRQVFPLSVVSYINSPLSVIHLWIDGGMDFGYNTVDNGIQHILLNDLYIGDTVFVETQDTEEKLELPIVCTNFKYALIYKNSRGGYDSMLFNPQSQKSDTIKTDSFLKYTDTGLHTGVYQKNIDESWKLLSPILNDHQSKLFQELIESPDIYIQILDEGDKLIPVYITDTTATEKTFVNNSRKVVTYSITVKNSETKYRR